jgi:hypothetical protein
MRSEPSSVQVLSLARGSSPKRNVRVMRTGDTRSGFADSSVGDVELVYPFVETEDDGRCAADTHQRRGTAGTSTCERDAYSISDAASDAALDAGRSKRHADGTTRRCIGIGDWSEDSDAECAPSVRGGSSRRALRDGTAVRAVRGCLAEANLLEPRKSRSQRCLWRR